MTDHMQINKLEEYSVTVTVEETSVVLSVKTSVLPPAPTSTKLIPGTGVAVTDPSLSTRAVLADFVAVPNYTPLPEAATALGQACPCDSKTCGALTSPSSNHNGDTGSWSVRCSDGLFGCLGRCADFNNGANDIICRGVVYEVTKTGFTCQFFNSTLLYTTSDCGSYVSPTSDMTLFSCSLINQDIDN